MQQLCERGRGSFAFYHLRPFLVGGQLAEHASRDPDIGK